MNNTVDIMAEEFKIAYPLTYDAIYNKGRVEGIRELAKYLVIDGYIRYGFEADYLVNQFMKKKQIE